MPSPRDPDRVASGLLSRAELAVRLLELAPSTRDAALKNFERLSAVATATKVEASDET